MRALQARVCMAALLSCQLGGRGCPGTVHADQQLGGLGVVHRPAAGLDLHGHPVCGHQLAEGRSLSQAWGLAVNQGRLHAGVAGVHEGPPPLHVGMGLHKAGDGLRGACWGAGEGLARCRAVPGLQVLQPCRRRGKLRAGQPGVLGLLAALLQHAPYAPGQWAGMLGICRA